ncbi:MAG: divergent PAP2 family protein [Patescibacteria group bacterium]
MTYWVFALPIAAGIVTQLTKVIIESAKGQFSWHQLKNYGGMPSSHSAFVVGLMTEIMLIDGLYSTTFAIALVFTILMIRDATGYRLDIGKHAEILNHLVKELPAKEQNKFPFLDERVGHHPKEILVGALIGIAVVLISNIII